jgi:hypothetical protein
VVGGKASKMLTEVLRRSGSNQLRVGCGVSSVSRVPKCKIPIVKISLAGITQQRRERVKSGDEIGAVKSRTEMALSESRSSGTDQRTRGGRIERSSSSRDVLSLLLLILGGELCWRRIINDHFVEPGKRLIN